MKDILSREFSRDQSSKRPTWQQTNDSVLTFWVLLALVIWRWRGVMPLEEPKCVNRIPRAGHVACGVCVGFRRAACFTRKRVRLLPGGWDRHPLNSRAESHSRGRCTEYANRLTPYVCLYRNAACKMAVRPARKRVTVGLVGKVISVGQLCCLIGNYINITVATRTVNPFGKMSNPCVDKANLRNAGPLKKRRPD